jgi:hypothetical protein
MELGRGLTELDTILFSQTPSRDLESRKPPSRPRGSNISLGSEPPVVDQIINQ